MSASGEATRPELGPWLSAVEASKYVGVSWPTLREWILDHQVPHVRMGRRWKINRQTLDEHLTADADAQVGVSR